MRRELLHLLPSESQSVRADLATALKIARKFQHLQRCRPSWARVCARANAGLACEWIILIGLTYVFVYAVQSWPVKIAILIPWFIYSTLALDNIVHHSNHWPLFKKDYLNVCWRALGVLVFWCPLEVRYGHWQHHRSYDLADDPQILLRRLAKQPFWKKTFGYANYITSESLRSVWGFLPWSPLPDYIRVLRESRPAHYWEIIGARWACLAWLLVLLFLDFSDTVIFFLPTAFLLSPFASVLMNLTDHLPADLRHPFRQATYFEATTTLERLLSTINHQTAATHLTHHLFPQVHFAHAERLQRRLLVFYNRHQSPRSLILNTTIIGNPIAVLLVLREVFRQAATTVEYHNAATSVVET